MNDRPRTVSTLTDSRRRGVTTRVPWIRLQGRHLAAIGFTPGARFTIDAAAGMLTLRITNQTERGAE